MKPNHFFTGAESKHIHPSSYLYQGHRGWSLACLEEVYTGQVSSLSLDCERQIIYEQFVN